MQQLKTFDIGAQGRGCDVEPAPEFPRHGIDQIRIGCDFWQWRIGHWLSETLVVRRFMGGRFVSPIN
jgi:hypothetical protein